MSKEIYKEIASDYIRNLLKGDLILIVTATDTETSELHKALLPLQQEEKILKLFEGAYTYYFGVFGKYRICHVQCSMGSISRSSSITTISSALLFLKSRVVVMIGIAFGVNEEKQQIGDVLISESIIPYNSKRVGEKATVQRGIEAPSSQVLLSRFKAAIITWEYFLSDDVLASLIPTRILSGEELVDNKRHRNKLVKENPDSKGGEMEGAGLYSACDGRADWILIKGICDFADGAKGFEKEKRQRKAMGSAINACMEVFSSPGSFQYFNIEIEQIVANSSGDNKKASETLFDLYDGGKEKYYVERDNDLLFNQKLSQYGVWVWGPSGCGKSNLILRNLQQKHPTFIQVNLAYCGEVNVDEYFNELVYELSSRTEKTSNWENPKDFKDCIKTLLALFSKHYKDKKLIIFIEEIPISNDQTYKEFTERFFSLLIMKGLISGLDQVKFVLSSINDPKIDIAGHQQKIHQQLSFIEFDYWILPDSNKLIDLIEENLAIRLEISLRTELISKSMGSPRFIKKFFRSVVALNRFDSDSLSKILIETERELNY